MKNMPNIPKNTVVMARLPPVNPRRRKKRMGSIGSATLRSQATNTTSNRAAVANPATISGSVHPYTGASMTA